MKQVIISLLAFIVFILLAVLFSGCEKQCLHYSCKTYNDRGEVEYITVDGSNALVYGKTTKCHCVDEVNRYVR